MDELIVRLEGRQEVERASLQEEISVMMKGAKKSKKRDLETKAMQMEYDLRAKHIEEMDFLEENGFIEGDGVGEGTQKKVDDTDVVQDRKQSDDKTAEKEEENEDNQKGLSKKEKAQRKKEKKLLKEKEKLAEKEKLKEEMADLPSQRQEELAALNRQLLPEGLEVKDVAADGHCLYRAIADQVQLVHSKGQLVQTSVDIATITFSDIRKLAADQMRTHVDMYAPFLALPGSCPEYDAYCDNVESVSSAVWGGQTELSAIAACLQVPIWVYEVGRPVLKMENGNSDTDAVLKVSYHRHFYALGEHYNSVKPVPQEVC